MGALGFEHHSPAWAAVIQGLLDARRVELILVGVGNLVTAGTQLRSEGSTDWRNGGLDDVPGVAVEVRLAEGTKCARSWKILPSVGSDPEYPDVTPRDAEALREWDAAHARA